MEDIRKKYKRFLNNDTTHRQEYERIVRKYIGIVNELRGITNSEQSFLDEEVQSKMTSVDETYIDQLTKILDTVVSEIIIFSEIECEYAEEKKSIFVNYQDKGLFEKTTHEMKEVLKKIFSRQDVQKIDPLRTILSATIQKLGNQRSRIWKIINNIEKQSLANVLLHDVNWGSYTQWVTSHLELSPCIVKKDGKKIKYVDSADNEFKREVAKEREAIKRYIQSLDSNYLSWIQSLKDNMVPMKDTCRVCVNVPAHNEGKTMSKFLEIYSTQRENFSKLLNPDLFEINIILNGPADEPEDREAINAIETFKQMNPSLKVNYVIVKFEPNYAFKNPFGNRPLVRGVGLARKIITDICLIRSLERTNQTGCLYFETEDADHKKIDTFAIRNVIAKLDANPHLDAVYGIQDRDPSIMKQHDLLFMYRRIAYYIERLWQKDKLIIGKKIIHRRPPNALKWSFSWHRVHTGGWNTAYTAEIYAMIKGYNGSLTKGEDIDIGYRISFYRGHRINGVIQPCLDTIGRTKTRISSSARRWIVEIRDSRSGYDKFEDASFDRELKSKTDEELLEGISRTARISEGNVHEFEKWLGIILNWIIREEEYNQEIAEYLFRRAMFFIGFKNDDYYLERNGNQFGVRIKNINNYKTYINQYRTLEKDKIMEKRKISSIRRTVDTLREKSRPDATLFDERENILTEINKLMEDLNKLGNLKDAHKLLEERLVLISDRSQIIEQTEWSLKSLIQYVSQLRKELTETNENKKSKTMRKIIDELEGYLSALTRQKEEKISPREGLGDSIIRGVLANYELGDIRSIKPLSGGVGVGEKTIQPSSIVTTKGNFVIKMNQVADGSTPEEKINNDYLLFTYLMDRGFTKIPNIYLSKKGFPYIIFDGKYYVVSKFIEGSVLQGNKKIKMLEKAGYFLAEYHAAVSRFRSKQIKGEILDVGNDFKESFRSVKYSIIEAKNDSERFFMNNIEKIENEIDILIGRLKEINLDNLLRLWTHGDYHWGNLRVKEDTINGLFDFDLARDEIRIADFINGIIPILRFDLLKRFVGAYQKRAISLGIPLNDDEIKAIPLLFKRKQLGMLRWLTEPGKLKEVAEKEKISFYKKQLELLLGLTGFAWEEFFQYIKSIK